MANLGVSSKQTSRARQAFERSANDAGFFQHGMDRLVMPIISGVIQYLNEVRSEMSKVTWPSRNQTVKMTIIVLIVSVIVGILIGGLDLLLTRFFGVLIKR